MKKRKDQVTQCSVPRDHCVTLAQVGAKEANWLLTIFFFLFQTEFIAGLLKVVVQKLEHSIPQIIDDDILFSHFIDELLLFNKELGVAHNYHSTEHGCLHVLTTDSCLARWLELERNCK